MLKTSHTTDENSNASTPDTPVWRQSRTIKDGLNAHYTNANIEWAELSDEQMRSFGFSDNRETHWYKMWNLGNDISLNITIPKPSTNDDIDIAVLDENFLQPYDYQYILMNYPNNSFAKTIQSKVETIIEELQNNNLLRGHVKGDYI